MIGQYPLKKPLLIYDGDCTFCRYWIYRWKNKTLDRIDYEPYQTAMRRFPAIPLDRFQSSVQFIAGDGKVFSGAEAVFQFLHAGRRFQSGLFLYKHCPGFAPTTEWIYRWVARHRWLFSKLFHDII